MVNYLRLLVVATCLSVVQWSGLAADDEKSPEKSKTEAQETEAQETEAQETDAMKKVKMKYDFTDKIERCINIRRVRSTRVLNDQSILFIAMGGKAYLNDMGRKCPGLKREERFMYRLSGSRLCSVDIITILDSFGREWASCGLGKFQVLEKKPKDK